MYFGDTPGRSPERKVEPVASVEDRWVTTVGGRRVPTERHGRGSRYVVRYRDPSGRQRHKSFKKKVDADRFAVAVEADKLRGTYIDPSAGRVSVRQYAEEWLAGQTFDPSTREATEVRLRRHILPHLGDCPIGALRPSQVQAWLRALQQQLAPRYVRVIFANLSAVLSAAVDDEMIAKNPCRAPSIRLPRQDPDRIEPWSLEEVRAVQAALPSRFRLMATLAAGLGLRQGEIFGLSVEDVDFLRAVVHVRRQVKIVNSQQLYALPKGRRTRDVPLPDVVALEIAHHLATYPAGPVSLPWQSPDGERREVAVVLSTREGHALNRNYVNAHVWKPALVAAGSPAFASERHACPAALLRLVAA